MCVRAQLCPTLCNPMDVASQAPCQWNFPDKTTGVGSHFLLQGIILTQGSNPIVYSIGRWVLYHCATWKAPTCHTVICNSSVDGNLGCSTFLAIMNNATMDIGIQVLYEHMFSVLVGI